MYRNKLKDIIFKLKAAYTASSIKKYEKFMHENNKNYCYDAINHACNGSCQGLSVCPLTLYCNSSDKRASKFKVRYFFVYSASFMKVMDKIFNQIGLSEIE